MCYGPSKEAVATQPSFTHFTGATLIARLTLLEANQAALAKQNREDINHLEAQNAILTQHVHGLQNQNANLTQYVHQLEAQLGRYQQENSNLTGYIHTLESELSRLSAKADRHVSFHSRLTSDEHLTSTQPLLLQDVLSNDGGAYNAATGRFVVPYNAYQAVQWTTSLPDQTTVNACLGDDVLFNWNYTLADGETVEDIKWHHANDKSNQLIGIYSSVCVCVSDDPLLREATLRVDEVKARLTLVEASQAAAARQNQEEVHRLEKQNADLTQQLSHLHDLATRRVSFHVRMSSSSQDKMKLSSVLCAVLFALIIPACQAGQWTTSLPDQRTVNACLGDDVLFNWNYTLADGETVEDVKCDDPLLREATLRVDEVKARLTLVEASQAAAARQNQEEVHRLEKQNADLTQQVHGLKTQNANLTQQLSHLHDLVTRRVSFHVRMSSYQRVP
nr:hypothetical protein BaRGS_015789 [Batillaria attramentaria]